MKYAFYAFLGTFLASIIMGSWWAILASGVVALIIRRSYPILFIAIVLDLWFSSSLSSPWHIGFFTITFLLTTFVAENVKKRIFWGS